MTAPCPTCAATQPHLHDLHCPTLAAATLAVAGWWWTSTGAPRGDEVDVDGRRADEEAARVENNLIRMGEDSGVWR